LGLLVLAQTVKVTGEVIGLSQGVGMVLAENDPAPSERVLADFPGLLVLAQPVQIIGEVVGRTQGVGMVLAENHEDVPSSTELGTSSPHEGNASSTAR
jgi:hypothetical protein